MIYMEMYTHTHTHTRISYLRVILRNTCVDLSEFSRVCLMDDHISWYVIFSSFIHTLRTTYWALALCQTFCQIPGFKTKAQPLSLNSLTFCNLRLVNEYSGFICITLFLRLFAIIIQFLSLLKIQRKQLYVIILKRLNVSKNLLVKH